jgi:hypothetical protein
MANITLQPSRPASAILSALDAVLDRVEGFLRSFFSDHPGDLQNALHEARIRHMTACGSRGQAMI